MSRKSVKSILMSFRKSFIGDEKSKNQEKVADGTLSALNMSLFFADLSDKVKLTPIPTPPPSPPKGKVDGSEKASDSNSQTSSPTTSARWSNELHIEMPSPLLSLSSCSPQNEAFLTFPRSVRSSSYQSTLDRGVRNSAVEKESRPKSSIVDTTIQPKATTPPRKGSEGKLTCIGCVCM